MRRGWKPVLCLQGSPNLLGANLGNGFPLGAELDVIPWPRAPFDGAGVRVKGERMPSSAAALRMPPPPMVNLVQWSSAGAGEDASAMPGAL